MYNNSVRLQGKGFEPKPVEDFLPDWWRRIEEASEADEEPSDDRGELLRKKAATAFAAFGGVDTTDGN